MPNPSTKSRGLRTYVPFGRVGATERIFLVLSGCFWVDHHLPQGQTPNITHELSTSRVSLGVRLHPPPRILNRGSYVRSACLPAEGVVNLACVGEEGKVGSH